MTVSSSFPHAKSTDRILEVDERCHLFGTTRMVDSLSQSAICTTLREAANWVALRQEIHIALTNRQPVSIALEAYHNSSSFQSDTDDAWANRMVFLFAKVMNYAFQPNRDTSEDTWMQLEAEVETWNFTKPQHFSPLWLEYSTQPGHSPFPEIVMFGSPQGEFKFQTPYSITTSECLCRC